MISGEQQIGSFGKVDESYAAGVGSVEASGAVVTTPWGFSGSVDFKGSLDAKILIKYLADKNGGAIPEEVASFLNSILAVT